MLILVTGSQGLIGRALIRRLTKQGIATVEFDLLRAADQDTRDPAAIGRALSGVTGVVHLAAVSRVAWAERDPDRAVATNVDALRSLLGEMKSRSRRPWLVFASSREVYGEPHSLPVREYDPLAPMNVYAHTKVDGERLVEDARDAGMIANIVRFSNVYGDPIDHADRVVPAFARAAATAGELVIEGSENMFDFTHIDDVSIGLAKLVEATAASESLPPVHLVCGVGTTLGELAKIAMRHAVHPLRVRIAAPRNFDVARFTGDPSRAEALLGWRAEIGIEDGFAQLTEAFRLVENDKLSRRAFG